MATKSSSDFYSFSLYIFDLDNTIYREEDYLFQAYRAVAEKFIRILPGYNKNQLYQILKDLFEKEGREKLFDKFLNYVGLDSSYLPECLKILRSFEPEKPIEIENKIRKVLTFLKSQDKSIYVFTNGNPDQQKNKIKHIRWNGLDKNTGFVYANETEPKPSPAGIFYILEVTGIRADKTIFIGDSDVDEACARNSGIRYLDVKFIPE